MKTETLPAQLSTERLSLEPLQEKDALFVLKLLNTPGWLAFIGDRKIRTLTDAEEYIRMILSKPNIQYWVIKLKQNAVPAGVVTFIQRDYLEHPDIGFALIPEYTGKGYAFEAASGVLSEILKRKACSHIAATTLEHNHSSIRLLESLGLRFSKEIQVDGEKLLLYIGNVYELRNALSGH